MKRSSSEAFSPEGQHCFYSAQGLLGVQHLLVAMEHIFRDFSEVLTDSDYVCYFIWMTVCVLHDTGRQSTSKTALQQATHRKHVID